MTGTAVAKQGRDKVRAILKGIEADITQLLPTHMKAEAPRFLDLVRVAMSKNAKLQKCSEASIITAVAEAADLGLELGGPRQQAALVPYNGEAQFQPMYRGLIALATRDGKIRSMEAHVVHKNDKFKCVYGANPILEHEPVLEGEPGPTIAAYSLARFADGSPTWEMMTRADLDKVQKTSRAQGSDSPWAVWPDPMRCKTVVKRHCKFLPCSPQLARAIEIDNRHVGIEEADFEIIKEDKLAPGKHNTTKKKAEAKAESKPEGPVFNVKAAEQEIQDAIDVAVAQNPQDEKFLKAFDEQCAKLGRKPLNWAEAGEGVIESLLGTVRDFMAAQE